MSKLIHLRYSNFLSVKCTYFYSGPDGANGNPVWGVEEIVKSRGPFVCFNLLFIHSWTGCDTCSTPHGIGGWFYYNTCFYLISMLEIFILKFLSCTVYEGWYGHSRNHGILIFQNLLVICLMMQKIFRSFSLKHFSFNIQELLIIFIIPIF